MGFMKFVGDCFPCSPSSPSNSSFVFWILSVYRGLKISTDILTLSKVVCRWVVDVLLFFVRKLLKNV